MKYNINEDNRKMLCEAAVYSFYTYERMGDCPNIERVLTDIELNNGLWKDIYSAGNLKCQQNIISNMGRIISREGIIKGNGNIDVMLEKTKRLSDGASFLCHGDIIGVSRKKGVYCHYGIYTGEGRVIHYAAAGGDFGHYNKALDCSESGITIHESSLKEFLLEDEYYFVLWFCRGKAYQIQNRTSFILNLGAENYLNQIFDRVYSPEETIKRARGRIGEQGYNLTQNNCEHFAIWCKTGISECHQVNKFRALVDAISGSR